MAKPALKSALLLAAGFMLSACSSDPTPLPDAYSQSLAQRFAALDGSKSMPTGWRQLDGSEINFRFANETYAIYSVNGDQELLVVHLSDNFSAWMDRGGDTRVNCNWNTRIDQLNLGCADGEKQWRIYVNGPDMVAYDREIGQYAILRKRASF